MKIKKFIKSINWSLVGPVLLLSLLGLLTIYNASIYDQNFSVVKKQAIFIGFSLVVLLLTSRFDFRIFKSNSYLVLFLYIGGVLLLLGLLFVSPIRDIHGWYNLGLFTFDPVPFMGIILIIFFAKYFSQRHAELNQLKKIFASAFFVLLPTVLVFLQPDFGSASILFLIWLGIILVSGIHWKKIIILLLIFSIIAAGLWFFALKDYQRSRVLDFVGLRESNSWNARQSVITIGAGGFLGRGLTGATQTRYGFLPEARSDFIFAALAEQFGVVGVLLILALFGFIIYKIAVIARHAHSNFGRLFGTGLIILIISQVFIHVAMNLKLIPIVGLSLPLVSYGGSNIIALYAAIGLIISVEKYS